MGAWGKGGVEGNAAIRQPLTAALGIAEARVVESPAAAQQKAGHTGCSAASCRRREAVSVTRPKVSPTTPTSPPQRKPSSIAACACRPAWT